jgi:hypothetical protein
MRESATTVAWRAHTRKARGVAECSLARSGRLDSNQRPPGPQPGALPDCATPRGGVESRPLPSASLANVCSMEGLRRCGRCGEEKPADDFAWRRRRRLQRDSLCRPCRSAYGREHYEANRQRYIDQARVAKAARRLKRTRFLIEFFKTHPCADCGERDPVVLEFDHIEAKSFDIAQALPDRKWRTILDEMAKCEVVCANCHRRRTARRRGAMRVLLTES